MIHPAQATLCVTDSQTYTLTSTTLCQIVEPVSTAQSSWTQVCPSRHHPQSAHWSSLHSTSLHCPARGSQVCSSASGGISKTAGCAGMWHRDQVLWVWACIRTWPFEWDSLSALGSLLVFDPFRRRVPLPTPLA